MHLQKELVNELTEDKRLWDSQELYSLIKNTSIFWSWGVSTRANIENKAMLLKVNGHHFKGIVLITLAANDTFTIYYIKEDKVVDSIENIYIDELVNTIDKKVEYIDAYH